MARDATVLSAYHRSLAFAAQRRYARMSTAQQRVYAAAHPSFVSRFGNVVPEHVRFAMVDAGDDDAADAIWTRYVRDRERAATQRYLTRQRVSFGERVIYVILAACLLAVLGAALAGVAYVAAGHHGAVTAGAATLAVFTLYSAYRLTSGTR